MNWTKDVLILSKVERNDERLIHMSLSMRRITRFASSVVDHLKEAAEKVGEEAKKTS